MKEKLSNQDIDDLRKSLTVLGMSDSEIEEVIEKAVKEDIEEKTIEEKAKTDNPEDEDLEKSCEALKAKKAEIEKSIDEIETKLGKKVEKSIENDFEKSFGERFLDIEKSFNERFEEIEKSISDKFSEQIEDLTAEVKKIGDTPLGMKSVVTKANFFEKGVEDELGDKDEKTLSISRNRDELIKGMTDMLNVEKDDDVRELLANGISDYTVNARPTNHGIKALAYMSRKNNITLEQ